MIAIQNPVNPLSSTMPSYHRRLTHGRHPSAPVVVRPTHVPGLLSLSKPVNAPAPRPQQQQAQPRAPRSSPKGKVQRSHQKPLAQGAVEVKQSALVRSEADKLPATTAAPATQEKSPRGRQPKQPSHDQSAGRRSMSLSSRPQARRPAHQPSPSPSPRIPQQADNTARPTPVNSPRAQPATNRPTDSNLLDPFLVHPSQDNESTETEPARSGSNKSSTFRAPPEIASRPTGKLARRRQNADHAPSTPTPSKAVPVPRSINGRSAAGAGQLSRSVPPATTVTPHRPNNRRVSTGPAISIPAWDSFPICDDSDDVTPPSTPLRETASVPAKKTGATTWQQQALLMDDAPRTAPPSATFTFPISHATTPTPAQRRRNPRNHQRVPSEGMFAMSADEDSSASDAAEELKAMVGLFPKRRAMPPRKSPSPSSDLDASPANFYAGSVFQNSPSPEELPVPVFRA